MHMESTRAMTRERGSSSESKNCKILLLPTADRRFDTKVKCPVVCLGGGGMGGFGIDRYINQLSNNPAQVLLYVNSIEKWTGMKNTGLKRPEEDQIYV